MNLLWDKCDTLELAKKYGTPLYVLSETKIRERCRIIQDDFLKKYDNTKAVYASKAFLTTAMCKIIEKEGLGLDVVSGGELYTAIQAGFPMAMVEFNGNNKTIDELELAVNHEIGRIIVDNAYELDLLEKICKEKNKVMDILFRIVPEADTDTHEYISTGHKSSKFGINLLPETIFSIIKRAVDSDYVNFKGIHFHVGSQLHDNKSHLNAISKTLHLIKDLKDQNITVEDMNIGGGFGIHYTDDDQVKPLAYFLEPSMKIIEDYCQENDLERPMIIIEPGRWIIGEAGITLYTVGAIKTNGDKKYISIDGGMSDNIRPSLYQAKYHADICNRLDEDKTDLVTVSGKFCESSDLLIRDIYLPKAQSGDILAVYSTGAYTYSMACNYNKQPIPGVVLACEGKDYVLVKKQTFSDLIRNECIPSHLEE
ncbi:diaminopimelate decarboxylase [Acidaminobacter sp. JC074]|uniref:diaminopimelate decarboxylase n=1 Tax=Acidaminobacter sp. JC074 TaxID=2530199 RepID=UPI001F0EA590|nr:diaminopimelate decarboxylase [Acidaminobacter sp. JC074]